jgi:hypothetical protein
VRRTAGAHDERAPFWLVALVAGVTTFALVAILGVLVLRRGRPQSKPAPGIPPEIAVFSPALAEYLTRHDALPKAEEVRPSTKPASAPGEASGP